MTFFSSLICLCAGFVTSAGVYALITVIGILPRLAERTKTQKHIHLYEGAIISGCTSGNLFDLFIGKSIFPGFVNRFILGMSGLFSGVFVGCLIMALAENIQVLPIMCRRLKIATGVSWMTMALAFGKLLGAFMMFFYGW